MQIEGKIGEFIDYFKTIETGNADLKFFLYGGVELGIDRAVGDANFAYPMLWLEQPSVQLTCNDMGLWSNKYKCAFSVITKADMDSYTEQEAASASTFAITGVVIKKLIEDAKFYKLVNVRKGFELDEVDRGWAMNHIGWRVSFEIDMVAREWLNGN